MVLEVEDGPSIPVEARFLVHNPGYGLHHLVLASFMVIVAGKRSIAVGRRTVTTGSFEQRRGIVADQPTAATVILMRRVGEKNHPEILNRI